MQRALEEGADVILAGRSCDVSNSNERCLPFAAGDIGFVDRRRRRLSNAALLCVPPSATDCMLVTIRDDDFIVRALNPDRRVTAASAAAHSLYEQPHPSPDRRTTWSCRSGGRSLDELADGSVSVSGSSSRRPIHTP